MAKRVQLIRHLTAAADVFLGLIGELTVDTSKNNIRVHDGVTPGGIAVAREDLTTSPAATPVADGKMSATQAAKLNGIEASATGDQTGAEIKTLYEAEADTNAYTDAEKTKLAGVEAGATADQTGAEIKTAYEAEADTNAFTDALLTKLNSVETNATADFASGVRAPFHQATAPAGWTKDVTASLNNSAIRIVTGALVDGGADDFSTVFGAAKATAGHAVTTAEMPTHLHAAGTLAGANHAHRIRTSSETGQAYNNTTDRNIISRESGNTIFGINTDSPSNASDPFTSTDGVTITGSTANAGSGDAHTHGLTLDLKFVDLIIASKD